MTVQGGSVMYKDQDQPQLKRRRSEDPGNKFIIRTSSPQAVSFLRAKRAQLFTFPI